MPNTTLCTKCMLTNQMLKLVVNENLEKKVCYEIVCQYIFPNDTDTVIKIFKIIFKDACVRHLII